MPVTMERVREQLEPIEPDYVDAAMLGEDAMPFLEQLADSGDPMLASRAVHLAGLIGGDIAVRMLRKAASSPDPVMRVQAAAVARHLPGEAAEDILLNALGDADSGVRSFALKTIRVMAAVPATIQEKLKMLSTSDPEPFVRKLSDEVLREDALHR